MAIAVFGMVSWFQCSQVMGKTLVMRQSVVVYEYGANLRLQGRPDGDMVWLTQEHTIMTKHGMEAA